MIINLTYIRRVLYCTVLYIYRTMYLNVPSTSVDAGNTSSAYVVLTCGPPRSTSGYLEYKYNKRFLLETNVLPWLYIEENNRQSSVRFIV